MSSRIEFGLISQDQLIIDTTAKICREFKFSRQVWPDVVSYFEDEIDCRFMLYSCLDETLDPEARENALIEFTQTANQICSNVYIMGIVPKKIPKEKVAFLKRCGIDTIIIQNELVDSSKLGFMASQAIRAELIPIKESDLIPNIPITFDIFHLLPLRKKFLKLMKSGSVIEETRIEKLRSVGEFYVARNQVQNLKEYINAGTGTTKDSQIKKCRAYFLDFSVKFLNMVNVLSDQSVTLSFEEGKELMDETLEMANQLSQVLTTVEPQDIWNIINNSVIGEFGSLERSPAIAAYVAYFGTLMGLEDLDEIIFAALLADIGMINLPLSVTKKIRYEDTFDFTAEETSKYRAYPKRTLEMIANRRLPVEQKIKTWIIKCREQADGKGFPESNPNMNIPIESQLLLFSFLFDQKTILKLGKPRQDREKTIVEMIQQEEKKPTKFSVGFMIQLKKALAEILPDDLNNLC